MNSGNGNGNGNGSLLERLHSVLGDLKLSEADILLESHLQRASQGDRPYADFLLDLLTCWKLKRGHDKKGGLHRP